MGAPTFRSGLIFGHRVFTTVGQSFVTAPLQFNDKLKTAWKERDGTQDPFTGAYYYDTSDITEGFMTVSTPSPRDLPEIIQMPSGAQIGHRMTDPRQYVQWKYEQLIYDEYAMLEEFIMSVIRTIRIKYTDEWGNVHPGRIWQFTPAKEVKRIAHPYDCSGLFKHEFTQERLTRRSGSQLIV